MDKPLHIKKAPFYGAFFMFASGYPLHHPPTARRALCALVSGGAGGSATIPLASRTVALSHHGATRCDLMRHAGFARELKIKNEALKILDCVGVKFINTMFWLNLAIK